MPSIFSKAVALLTGDETSVDWLKMPKQRKLKSLTERDLINLEAEIGATLFGPIPRGHRREFFCLDARTWIWHEEWMDEVARKLQTATTRYEIQDNAILKVQEGARYSYVEGQELENLQMAIQMYYERVARELYHIEPEPIA
jgi:hypothetical protein